VQSHSKLSRRDAMRLGAGTLLALGLWPGVLRAADVATEDFTFIEVNDVHSTDDKDGPWLEGLIRQMKATPDPKPQLCLVAGDLAENGTTEQIARMRDIFNTLGLPYYVVPGNHDHIAPNDRKPYTDLFPDRLNYRFDAGGWQFIALDSTQGQDYQDTHVHPDTLRFIDETVPKLDRSRPTVVFTHFPLGPDVKYRPVNADDVLARFKDLNLRAVFCGHYHALTERARGEVMITTDRCCSLHRANHDGSIEKGYFLCRTKDGKIERSFVEYKPA
jgi:3',5'-cyclic AMP phosphodiesterase CpdA